MRAKSIPFSGDRRSMGLSGALKSILCVLSLMLYTGCRTPCPKPTVLKVPVSKPCIEEDLRLSPLPLEGINQLQVEKWIELGQYDKFRQVIYASYVILNEDVKALREVVSACK